MTGRKAPEATQEIDASDVLEVIQVAREERSYPSLAPLGVEIVDSRNDVTRQIRLVARRKLLSRYVIGAVALSCGILIASVIKRQVVAADDARPVAPLRVTAREPPPPPAPSTPRPPAQAFVAAPPPDPPAPVPATTADAPVTGSGSIRFAAPAKPGWVWLDGKRLTATSAIVTCGPHKVKVGYFAKHTVDVPCGGEVVLSH